MRTPLAVASLALVAVAATLALVVAAPARVGTKAQFKVSPRAPQVGRVLKFDGSASKCRRCRYRWHEVRRGKPRKLGKGKGKVLRHRFRTAGVKRIRLTVVDRQGRKFRRSRKIRIRRASPTAPGSPKPPAAPVSPLPPLGQPSCATGARQAATAAEVRSAVQSDQDVCVIAPVGNVNLDGLTSNKVRHVGTTAAGSIDEIHLQGGSLITLRARFRSIVITNSNLITIEQSQIGGTPANRTLDQLIFIPERSDDVTIRDNDIGWTTADNSGNTGYGIRAYNDSARLRIERNYIHHIGGDAIQLGMDGIDTLIDRNEIAYAARPAGSNEHSDDLQIIGNGPNMRVTNNYFHHCGWFTATGPQTGCNSMAIHAGTSNALVFENNIEAHALGLPFIGDLGTGGCVRSNAVFRRNTWFDNGTQFADKPDLQFGLCGGSNNLWERNLVVSKMNFSNNSGYAQSGTTARNNLVGNHAINASGDCTAAACNPAGAEPIGFRKPAGVHW
jgi:hypothetical protein